MCCTEQATTAPEGSPRAAANNVIQLYYISTLHLGQATTISPLPALAPKLSLSRQPPQKHTSCFPFNWIREEEREKNKNKAKRLDVSTETHLLLCSALNRFRLILLADTECSPATVPASTSGS